MPNIPAYCANCDIWFPSGYFIEDSEDITFSGNLTSCPKCGSNVPLINGVFNTIGDTLEIIKSQDFNEEELKTLTQILQRAIRLNTPAGQIRALIEKEVPKAVGLNKFIDDRRGLIAMLMLLLQIFAIAMPYIKSPSNNNDLNTEKITNAIFSLKPKEKPTPRVRSKVGVNDPCWCGSGKKRKKCHNLQSRPNAPNNLSQKPK